MFDPSISASLVMQLGGTPFHAGSLDSLINFGVITSASVAAYLLTRFSDYRQMFVQFSFCSFLSVAALSVFLYAIPGTVMVYIMMISLFAYYFFSGSLVLPLYELVNKFVDKQARVVLMSNTLAIGQFVAAIGSVGVRWILDRSSADPMMNYQHLYLAAASVAALCFATTLCFDKVKVREGAVATQVKASLATFYLKEYHEIKRDRSLRVFFLATVLFAVSWSSTGLFIGLGFRNDGERLQEILASGILWRTLIKACCFYICGQLARKYGNRTILIAIGAVGLLSPFASLLLPMDYFLIVIIATNITPMAYVYFIIHLIDITDDTTFQGHFTLFMLTSVPSALVIPILGLLIDHNATVFCLVMAAIQASGILLVIRLRGKEVPLSQN